MTLKTQETTRSVARFLRGVDDGRRKDCETVLTLMKRATKAEPRMWGSSIVGFGRFHYKYASGREGDWFRTGFSPRKQDLTLYLPFGFEKERDLMQRLGKYKTGQSCLYIKRLSDVDTDVLKELIRRSVAETRTRRS